VNVSLLFIAAGGAVGAVCRYLISNFFQRSADRFPVGTFIINISGSLLLGLLVGSKAAPAWSQFIGIGFCGAFTTFSTLQYELLQLKQSNQAVMFLYLILTYTCGMTTAVLGYVIGKMVVLSPLT
jgi:CrcB protein